MPRVTHFEINADKPKRAVKFYETVFGWTASRMKGPVEYWSLKTGDPSEPGIDGAVMKRMNRMATIFNGIEVDNIETYLSKIKENGGEAVTPVVPLPGIGLFAYFKDTEGNVFGLIEKQKG